MTASTGSDGNQTVSTFLDGFFGKPVVDDVVQRNATITVNRLVHFDLRTEGSDDDGHFVFDAHF